MSDLKSRIDAALATLGPDPEWARVEAAVQPLLGPYVGLQRPMTRSKGPFLRQRIPMSWIFAAGQLPGKALAIGLLLWNAIGPRGGRQVKLDVRRAAQKFGVHPDAVRRALKQLRRGGLIRVSARPGCRPLITLLDVGDEAPPKVPPTAGTKEQLPRTDDGPDHIQDEPPA